MTRILAYMAEAFAAIWRNRTRSLLTMLGMIIGTASVIAVLGIGNAASSGISGSLGSFGDPGYNVLVDPKQDNPAAAQIQFRDASTVAAEHDDIFLHVYPVYQRNLVAKANGITYEGIVVGGVDYNPDSLTMREGKRLGYQEVYDAEHVALLSQPVERRFFGPNGRGLGQSVRVNGVRFTVIGVYDELKASIFNNVGGSEWIEIPYTVFHEMAPGPLDGLLIYAKPGTEPIAVQDAVESSLRHIHGPQSKYIFQDSMAFINAFEKSIGVISIGVTAIGAVALVVAGIGIMNIMLVSVTERTREIGIRKAIGGSRNDIATQFLLEAVILSLIGGGIGMLFGVGFVVLASGVVSALLGPAPIPWLLIVGIAFGFSTIVGVAFGTYPAFRAGSLDPIEALRA